MNFDYYKKVLALPLKSTQKGVLRTLAYHCNPDLDNFCIPSWDTIQEESGVSRDVIGDTLLIAKEVGIIDYRHRGDVLTGKKANEYFFKFENIKFYKKNGKMKVSADTKKDLKQRLATAKANLEAEKDKTGKKPRNAFSDKSRYTTKAKNPDTRLIVNLNNPDTRLSYTQGLEGYSKSPDTRPINPDTRPEVIETEMLPAKSIAKERLTTEPCKEKKTVLHEKESNPFETRQQVTSNDSLEHKDPSKQSMDEWLADYENA